MNDYRSEFKGFDYLCYCAGFTPSLGRIFERMITGKSDITTTEIQNILNLNLGFDPDVLEPLPRFYHNMDHILRIKSDFIDTPPTDKWIPNIHEIVSQFAIAHDCIIVSGKSYSAPGVSERLSASFYRSLLKMYDPIGGRPSRFDEIIDRVYTAILASAYHTSDQPWLTEESKICLDLDLYGLADPEEQYDATTEKVRNEFVNVPLHLFVSGRIGFLKAMLARKQIYYFATQLEEPARANMKRELESYRGSHVQ